MALVVPSLLAANLASWAETLEIIKAAGASRVHVDVMDGHFVPDITVGQPVVASLRKATDLELEVHLLIERPERFVADFIDAGADWVTVNAEGTHQLHRTLDLIRQRGARAGVALNPGTALESVSEVLGEVDSLTILSADPGAEEHPFIPSAIDKVRAAWRAREERRLRFALQVEGGISWERMEDLVQAGADILVAGSAIFNCGDPKARLAEAIRRLAGAPQIARI